MSIVEIELAEARKLVTGAERRFILDEYIQYTGQSPCSCGECVINETPVCDHFIVCAMNNPQALEKTIKYKEEVSDEIKKSTNIVIIKHYVRWFEYYDYMIGLLSE